MPQLMTVPQTDFTPLETLAMSEIAVRAALESTRLGIFDALAESPLSAHEVAGKFGFQEAKTAALLDLLVSVGLLARDSGGYTTTPTSSEYLCHASPFFVGKGMELTQRFLHSVAADFTSLLRGSSDLRSESDTLWAVDDTLDGTEQEARLGSLQDVVAFTAGLPGFAGMRRMCDVGGNHGAFSMALLDRNPQLRPELADLPEVAAAATPRIAARGYADRMSAFACDLRTDALEPARYDLLLASHVLYGFMDRLPGLLSMFHRALNSGGWFVSHHMSGEGQVPALVTQARELVTRMAGYATHVVAKEQLAGALREAGFDEIRTAPAGQRQEGLIVAARKA